MFGGSGVTCRDNENAYSLVIASEAKQSRLFAWRWIASLRSQ
jgi:hypothetical protein